MSDESENSFAKGPLLLGQYLEIEQPDGSVIEMHRMVVAQGPIRLVVRCKAVPFEDYPS